MKTVQKFNALRRVRCLKHLARIFLCLMLMILYCTASFGGTVTADPLNFGNLEPGTSGQGTTLVHVTEANGVPYTVALDKGMSGVRTITATGGSITYELYTNAARTIVWGDGTGGSQTAAGTGNGTVQNITVYGTMNMGSGVVSGAYSETVTVTLTY